MSLSWVKAQIFDVWSRWEHYWFEKKPDRNWRVFRRLFGAFLFVFYALRIPDLEYFFGSEGILPSSVYYSVVDPNLMKLRWSLLSVFPDNMVWVHLLHAVFLISLLLLAFGVLPLWAALVACVLDFSFIHRSMMSVYGIDLIWAILFIYLCMAMAGTGEKAKKTWRKDLPSMALSLMQVQMAIIYTYAGWEKLKGTAWWRGEALWWVLSNAQQVSIDVTWIARFPLIIAVMTYSTLFWEVYFPFAIALDKWRRPWLIAGVAMHLFIAVFMNIPFFGLGMIISYVCFLDEKDFDWLSQKFGALPYLGKPIRRLLA